MQAPSPPPLNPALRQPFLVEKLFSAAECDTLIAAFAQGQPIEDPYLHLEPGRVAGATGKRRLLLDQGSSGWVLQRIMQAAFPINQQQYRFEIQGMEVPHLIEYQPGQQSYWHMDIADDHTSNRKLSLLVFLSDPASFEGGNFSVYPESLQIDQSRGNCLLFPAYLMHKVAPITAGLRYTLVTWGVGTPFR